MDDKEVIERFLGAYNAEFDTAYVVVSWPDADDRTGKAIDALASDGTTMLAIEHTLLQPFAGERYDTAVFLQTLATLDQAPHLMLPGLSVSLTFRVGAVPKRGDRAGIASAVEQWYVRERDRLPNGRSQHVIPDLPFTLETIVDRTPLDHPRGFFFIDRELPEARPLIETVQQALTTKVEKLTAAQADKRVLLLEREIPIFGNGQVGTHLEELRSQFPKLAEIDEVWIANTGGTAQDYFAIDLVWPLDAAITRDYARNDTK